MSGTKFGWSSGTTMSRTKMSGTKKRNKNEWNKKLGGPVEQKSVE